MLGAIEESETGTAAISKNKGEAALERQRRLGATAPGDPRFEEELYAFVKFHFEEFHRDYLPSPELASAMGGLVIDVYKEEDAEITNPDTEAQVRERVREHVDALANGRGHRSQETAAAGTEVAADPVNVFSGEFSYRATDLLVSGAGIDFAFRRTYRNQANYAGPLGPNWDHQYNLWLRVAGNTVFRSTGRMAEEVFIRHPRFGEAGFDYFAPPDGQTAILLEEDGGFVLREDDGLRHVYALSPANPLLHRIARISDRFENSLEFTYADDLLVRVTVNHPQRFVIFTHDDCRRITAISDHSGRVWRYRYDDFGDLVEVVSPATEDVPEGARACYRYSTVSHTGRLAHNLTEIVNGNGCPYLSTAYGTTADRADFNRVVVQREGNGITAFEYTDLVFEGDPRYPEHQRPAHQTRVRQRNGREIITTTNRRGQLLLSEEYAVIDSLPRWLRWRYRYNADGQLTAALTPSGCLTQYHYGREEFLRAQVLAPGTELRLHEALDGETRQGFHRLLAVVERASPIGPEAVDLSLGVWGDIFPSLFSVEPEDRIVKSTYEPRYGQLLTVSDPRFTQSADPNAVEDADYDRTLTRFIYRGPPSDATRLLDRISYPTPTLPDGTPGDTVAEHWPEHDEGGRPLRFINTAGAAAVYRYFDAADGNLSGFLHRLVIDPDGLANTTEYARDSLGRVTETRLPRSFEPGAPLLVKRTAYNALDQVVETVSPDPPAFRTRTRYDSVGREVRIEADAVNGAGQPIAGGPFIQTFAYDQEGRLVRRGTGGADERAHLVVTHRFDAAGLQSGSRRPGGTESLTRYDVRGQAVEHTRGHGTVEAATTSQAFDEDGRLVRSVDAEGFVTTYRYDCMQNIVAVTDALGNVAQRSYDKRDNLILERVFERGEDGSFQLIRRRTFDYDELGRRIRSAQDRFPSPLPASDPATAFLAPPVGSDSIATATVYDSGGRVIRVIDPLEQESTTDYDALDRPIRYIDPLGNRIENHFDGHGNLVRQDIVDLVIDELTGETREAVFSSVAEFDALDRLVTRTDGMGNLWRFEYDSRDGLERRTDPLGNLISYERDIHGRLTAERLSETDTGLGTGTPVGEIELRYDYDPDGNLVSLTDGIGRKRRWLHDGLGRVTAAIYPDGPRTRFRYDRRDDIAQVIEPNGLVRRQRMDALARLSEISFDRSGLAPGTEVAGPTLTRFSYDALGRRTQAQNDFVSCRFRYSSLGLTTEETQELTHPDAADAPMFSIARDYDDTGDLIQLSYPGSRVVSFERDAIGRTVAITNSARGDNYPGRPETPDAHEIARFSYAGRRLQRFGYPGGAETVHRMDAAGRIVEISHAAGGGEVLRQSQLYDGVGNLRLRQESASGLEAAERYAFDSLYRLADASTVVPADIEIDLFSPPAAPAEPVVDLQTGMNTLIGSLTLPALRRFEYDAADNRTLERRPDEPVRSYTTNDLDQYTAVAASARVHDANGNLIEDGTRRFVYDPNNLLTRVIDTSSGQELYRAVHDPLGRRTLELRDGAVRRLVYSGEALLAEHETEEPLVQYIPGPTADRTIQIATDGEEYWVHADLVGSTRLLSSADGTIVEVFNYSPFGRLIDGTPPSGVRILYAGRRLDPTGTYDHRARSYDPDTGRYLQRDPRDLADGTNLYAYTGNNPLSFADPTGTSREERSTGFHAPRLINTGRGTGGHPGTFYEDEEGMFVEPGQRGILAIEVDPEVEARLTAQRIRKSIAQRRAFQNIDRRVTRAMDRGATWTAVWAGTLAALPFVIEGGIVAAPWLVRGGGSLSTRLYLGGTAAGEHLAAGVSTFAEGSTLAALGVTGIESVLGIGGWRTQSSFRRWSLQRENEVIDMRAKEASALPAGNPGRNVRMPPEARPGDYKRARVPLRGTDKSIRKNIGAQRVTLDDGTVVVDEVYVSQKPAKGSSSEVAARLHNEQLGIGALDDLAVDPKRVREIWVYTERAPCLHCTRAVQGLEARYPNARIRVYDTYGKVSWREHHEEGLSGPM